jgi:peptidoglycan/xylan/chitin deacetylase (PgdA/CDA1 family)
MLDVLRSNEALWELFVKKEEHDARELDEHGRFLYKHSKHNDVMTPSVSRFLVENGLQPEYPGGKEFAVCLTHDIDQINPKFTVPFLSIGKRTRRIVRSLDRHLNPRWNFDDIMELESRFDAKSTFFFLALNRGEKDFNYCIADMAEEIKNMLRSGWSVGLHAGYEAFDNVSLLQNQKYALEQVTGSKVLGCRNHYLRFKTPATWKHLEEAGFTYDSTFGYKDHIGFRNGMCHPFRPYDSRSGRFLGILEVPLAIMDGTLLDFMGLSFEKALNLSKKLVDNTMECRGVVTVLWHNKLLERGGSRRLYEHLLEYCKGKGAWLTSTDEMCRWWTQNDFLGQGG